MIELQTKIQHILRSLILRIRRTKYVYSQNQSFSTNNSTQILIRNLLLSDSPCMVARFGSVELQSIIDYLYPATIKNILPFMLGYIPSWGYAPSTMKTMYINAGFFPPTRTMLNRFGKLMLESMKEVDLLGSWRLEEEIIMSYMPKVERVALADLEPYYFDEPWTTALEGKRILVIHPFEDTIRAQYQQLNKLFENQKLAPKYELLTIRAVQSIAGNKPEQFNDWFEALSWMKSEIDKVDFDVAIIGCGAYGFPLAAYVKQIGKKAIHLGGAVQILFGIRSNAADGNPRVQSLMNAYWVRPSANETPQGATLVENARYW